MALIELSRVIAADPAAGRRWAAEPLPDRAPRRHHRGRVRQAPGPGQGRAAARRGRRHRGPDSARHARADRADALAPPAEAAGLVRVDTSGPRFDRPLVRSAIYHTVPFAERAAAHRRIAEALRDQPDRYAWHLAAAAMGPDERVASLLEETAAQAQRRGGTAAAARALERAAEFQPARTTGPGGCSPPRISRRADRASRLGAGCATKVLSVTADPELRMTARRDAGWALAWSGRRTAALSALISVAEEASRDLPALAWDALGDAATVAYQSGDARQPRGRAPRPGTSWNTNRRPPRGRSFGALTPTAGSRRLWIRASTDPSGSKKPAPPGPAQDRRLAP